MFAFIQKKKKKQRREEKFYDFPFSGKAGKCFSSWAAIFLFHDKSFLMAGKSNSKVTFLTVNGEGTGGKGRGQVKCLPSKVALSALHSFKLLLVGAMNFRSIYRWSVRKKFKQQKKLLVITFEISSSHFFFFLFAFTTFLILSSRKRGKKKVAKNFMKHFPKDILSNTHETLMK